MTEPPPNSQDPHLQPLHTPPLIHGGATTLSSSSSLTREYRKGNWTIQETLILITAKKLDDERRLMKTSSTPQRDPTKPSSSSSAIALSRSSGFSELRWKWVENYCWSHGCLRSQNQCNDKWDNLLRDYKKVRDYESKLESSNSTYFPSYWTIEKHKRKDRKLPSNMVFEVYQAITQVLQRKLHPPQPQSLSQSTMMATQPPPQPPPPPPPQAPAVSEGSESSGTMYSEDDKSESKRRKVEKLGSSIMRSASELAQAIGSCEEKEEKRHSEMIEIHKRRLQMEETRNQVNQQGFTNLVAVMNNLFNAIQLLINSMAKDDGGDACSS